MPFKNIMCGRWYRLGDNHLHGYKLEVSPWSQRPLGLETLKRFLRFFDEFRSLNRTRVRGFPTYTRDLTYPQRQKSHILVLTDPVCEQGTNEYHQIVKWLDLEIRLGYVSSKLSQRVRSPHLVGTTNCVYWYAFSSVLIQESCWSCLCNDLS